jgi:hypothetical protein
MPAFGTGDYGMSYTDSAQAVFQALANVCPNLQHVRQIRIVIFQSKMVSTFQQTLQQYGIGTLKQSKAPKPSTASKPPNSSTANRFSKSGNEEGVMTKTIEFRLFGKSKDGVDRAQTALMKGLKETCKTHTVENKDVSKLSERQRKKLTKKARELDVTITFRNTCIVVLGDPEDVSVIINDIWEEIKKRSEKEKDTENARVLYKTIKWQYESHGIDVFFNERSNAIIEKAYSNNDTKVTVKVGGEKCDIYLAKYPGTELSTGKELSSGRTFLVTRTTATSKGEGK